MSSPIPKRQLFKPTSRSQQKHRQPLYCIVWSSDFHVGLLEPDKKYHYLATCGANQVTIYEVEIGNFKGVFEIIQSYRDNDKEEHFYACAYAGRSQYQSKSECPAEHSNSTSPSKRARTRDGDTLSIDLSTARTSSQRVISTESLTKGPQLLCVAGVRGLIKVLDPVQQKIITILRGHGSDIYDLKTSPTNNSLLLSASVDESVRLWNLETFACVAIFAGHHGHREAVLSVSWHPLGKKFASGGMDKSVRLWDIGHGRALEALNASSFTSSIGDRKDFHPLCEQYPYFATDRVHLNYVDCVHFLGDLILSKSTYNSIVLWLPEIPVTVQGDAAKGAAYCPPKEIIALRTFDLGHCNIWFVRFGVDSDGRYLAVGNIRGEVDIWDIDSCKKSSIQQLKPMVHSTIRMLAFSPDGSTLMACDDSASVCRWDIS